MVGLRFTGLLGILLEAKLSGLIPAAKPILDTVIEKAGFWVGREVYAKFLQQAGES